MARPSGGATARRQARRALDRRGPELRDLAGRAASPQGGWVRAIREALGMSAVDLGDRMGITETSVLSLERNELSQRVRLDTLARAAEALNCELVYALVPRRPLEQLVEEQALSHAGDLLRAVGHSMSLEGQRVDTSVAQEQLGEQARLLVDQPGLWRNDR